MFYVRILWFHTWIGRVPVSYVNNVVNSFVLLFGPIIHGILVFPKSAIFSLGFSQLFSVLFDMVIFCFRRTIFAILFWPCWVRRNEEWEWTFHSFSHRLSSLDNLNGNENEAKNDSNRNGIPLISEIQLILNRRYFDSLSAGNDIEHLKLLFYPYISLGLYNFLFIK